MARTGRIKSENGVYHVLLRGVDKLFIKDSDYAEFRLKMQEYFGKKTKLLAYLLLPNRVHLLVDEADGTLSGAIKPLCTSYARYFNREYNTEGKLFYDRFKSVPAENYEQISDTVAFFNAVGTAFAAKENFSLYEYTQKAVLCDTDRLKALISDSCSSTQPKTLHLDDYAQLQPNELAKYIEIVTGKPVSNLEKDSELLLTILSGRGLSTHHITSLLGLKPAKSAASKKLTEKKPEKPDETDVQKQKPQEKSKNNLSVWLL